MKVASMTEAAMSQGLTPLTDFGGLVYRLGRLSGGRGLVGMGDYGCGHGGEWILSRKSQWGDGSFI